MNGRDVSLILVVLVVVSTFSFTLVTLPENARATILYVGGPGPGNYTTIQSAIDDAKTGDTVYVFSGTYNEHLTINKTLNLTGEDRDSTIIDGWGPWDVVSVSADWVNISGFTVMNGPPEWDRAGILLTQVRNSRVVNCNVSANRFHGIFLRYSDDNTIANNTVLSNVMGGIYLLFSNSSTIAGNVLSDNYLGIFLDSTVGNTVTDNTMVDDGVFVNGYSVEYWNTHTIDTSNTVSGKPVHYWKDTVGGIIPPDAGQVILANCSGVTIENQNVSNGDVGISLGFSPSNIIANNTAWDGAIGAFLLYSNDSQVVNNIASRNAMRGISIINSRNNTIVDNTAFMNLFAGISVHDSSYITVFDNRVTFNMGIGVYVEDSSNVDVTKNTAYDNTEAAIWLTQSDGNMIANNTLSRITPAECWHQVVLYQSDNNTIFNNSASTTWDGRGIYLYQSDANTLALNNLSQNYYGILLTENSNNNSIVNNSAINNGFGIYSYRSFDNAIVNNSALWNSKGIRLRFSYDTIILNNNISGNVNLVMDGTGIEMWNSDRNFIVSNNISDNEYGMVLVRANGNKIAANMVFSNSMTGFDIDSSSSGNKIFHNSFMDNPVQANDYSPSNQWDDGYPSGGNYWNDYTGSDIFFGPDQDQPGADGIGDTPYDVDWNTTDRYPLVDPVEPFLPRPPTAVGADLTGLNSENVTLNWNLSITDIDGKGSILRYDIFRSTSYSSDPSGYLLYDLVPKGTYQYVDIGAGEPNPNNFFYVVCAVDWNGNSSCSPQQAAKFTRPASTGQNLVSIPLLQSNEEIESVLQTVKWDKAWGYDSSFQEWKWHMKFKPYPGELEMFTLALGIWMNVTEDSNLTVAGTVPLRTSIQLKAGWNLIGFPSFNSTYSVADLRAETGATRVEGFDALATPYFLRRLQDSDTFQAGQGYWVQVPTDVAWIVT